MHGQVRRVDNRQGVTVRSDKDGSITISRVLCGGAAGRSGMIHSGDMLYEINGVSVAGKTVDEVADMMMGV